MPDLLKQERKGFLIMNENIRSQLKKILNTMTLIHTSGEDTILMGECLVSLNNLLAENKGEK